MSSGLKQKDLVKFRKKLEEKRATILARKASKPAEVGSNERVIEITDLAQAEQIQQTASVGEGLDLSLLRQIEAALARIPAGEYGICADCGNRISRKRLDVVPWASYCVKCQDKDRSGSLEEVE